MPLRPGMPVSDAIHELSHHGSRPRSHEQIVAIAMANHDRRKDGGIARMAFGGDLGTMSPSFAERSAEREQLFGDRYNPSGFIPSSVAGRTDRIPTSVAADSFVVPADVLSGLGQGNSLAGAHIMDAVLSTGPYGTRLPRMGRGPGPPRHRASGGRGSSDVIVAGGEYIVPPDKVEEIGRRARAKGGKEKTDMQAGHRVLRGMVANVRQHQMKFLKSAPAPKK